MGADANADAAACLSVTLLWQPEFSPLLSRAPPKECVESPSTAGLKGASLSRPVTQIVFAAAGDVTGQLNQHHKQQQQAWQQSSHLSHRKTQQKKTSLAV